MNIVIKKIPKIEIKKYLKLLLIIVGFVFLGALTYFGYKYYYYKNIEIQSLMVVNQTENSATIIWQTDKKVFSEVEMNGEKYFDSRDFNNSENNQSVIVNREKRYTHYVTIEDLASDTAYSFYIKNGFVQSKIEDNLFLTAKSTGKLKNPEPVYGYVFDKNGFEINDALVIIYVEDNNNLSQPLATYVSENSSFTIDLSSIRDSDLIKQIELPKSYWELVYVWSEHGELLKRINNDYDQPIGGVGNEGNRLQYGETSIKEEEVKVLNNISFPVSAGKDSPPCSSGDATDQIYGECCGSGLAREVRRCVDAGSGAYYYQVSDCEHQSDSCGGKGLDSSCNNNGNRDCEGYSTDNCENGVDCGNSVCGACALKDNGGLSNHCSNGIKDDGIEEGVDCGGACPSCPGRSEAAEKSGACPPSGCIAPENVPGKTEIIQEVDVVTEKNFTSAGCGQPDTREGCVNSFGEEGCNVSEGGSCSWSSGWNNCVYGYTCSSGKCVKDTSVSACWGKPLVRNRYSGSGVATFNMTWDEAVLEALKSYPQFSQSDVVIFNDVNISSSMCIASDKIRCSNMYERDYLPDQAKVDLILHELEHLNQYVNVENNISGCPINPGSQIASCGHLTEVGAEAYSGNGGGYVFEVNGEWKCGTQIYDEMVQAVGNKNIVDRYFEFDCSVYDQVSSVYDYCSMYNQTVVSIDESIARAKESFRNENCLEVPVYFPFSDSNEQSLNNNSKNIIDSLSTPIYAESNVVETAGEYLVYIDDGIKQEIKYAVLHPGNKITVFYDLNKDRKKQDNEPIAEEISVKIEKIVNFMDFYISNGWNSIAFPMYLIDSVGNEITTAQQFLEYAQSKGLNISQMAKFQDGIWQIAIRRGKDQIANDFNLIPGEGYFIRSFESYEFKLKGYFYNEPVSIDLMNGWNLISINNPSKNNYSSEELIKSLNNSDAKVDIVTKWENGKYYNYIEKDSEVYGTPFTIYPTKGY